MVGAAGIEPIAKTTIFLNHLRASISPCSLQNVAKLDLFGKQEAMASTRINKANLKYFQNYEPCKH